MPDLGLAITGLAAVIAFKWGRGIWLRHVLILAWLVILAFVLSGAVKSEIVFIMAAVDLLIAGTALVVITNDPLRIDAKIVGAISMTLMPMHWIMTVSHGTANWTIYASAANAGFVLQCLIVRGWLDGLGSGIIDFVNRFRPVHLPRVNRDK